MLNESQFSPTLYHGTSGDLEGDSILPAHKLGATFGDRNKHYGQSRKEVASASEDEGIGWNFASLSASREASIGGTRGRARVHVVTAPDARIGVEHPDHPGDSPDPQHKEWVAPEFKVRDTIDIMPGHQGTFPSLNWNQFRGPNKPGEWQEDANHPADPRPERGSARVQQRRLGQELAGDHLEHVKRTHDPLF